MHDEHKIVDRKVLIALCLAVVIGLGVSLSASVPFGNTDVPASGVILSGQTQNNTEEQDQDNSDTGNSSQSITAPVQPVQHNDNSFPSNGDIPSDLDAMKIISITNAYRAQRGLSPLRYNETLALSADRKVDLILQEQHFEHASLSGKQASDLIQEVGYEFLAIGENLALGTYKSEQEIVDSWIQSPTHHAMLINPQFEDIAVGLQRGMFNGQHVWVAVQHFGRSLAVCTADAPQQNLKQQIDSQSQKLRVWEQEIQEKQAVLKEYTSSYGVTYDQIAREYDALVQQYNALLQEAKQDIDTYNQQVKAYNDCVRA